MRDLLSGGRFLNCGNYGIGEKVHKGTACKDPLPSTLYKIKKICKKPMLTAFKNRDLFSLFMRGVFGVTLT